MKYFKITLIFFVVLAALISTSCADSSNTHGDTELCYIIPGFLTEFEANHTAGDFQITVESININGDYMGIVMAVSNPTDKVASCDTKFDIEKLDNGTWVSCKTEEPKFEKDESGILQNNSAHISYDFGTAFSISEVGSYRFKTVIYNDATETRIANDLSIDFSVLEDPLVPSVADCHISNGGATLTLKWVNSSDKSLYIPNDYYLKKSTDDTWVNCNRTDNDFELSLLAVESGKEVTQTYVLEEMYELDQFGDYLMYIEYADSANQVHYAQVFISIPYEIEVTE